MLSAGSVVCQDGVAMLGRGDAILIVYQLAARLHRTRWLFARVNEYVAGRRGTFVVFMVVLPTADPPDRPTRAENAAELRKLGSRLRRLVTTPIGDAFRVSIVRTVMRALSALQGKAGVHFVGDSIDAGVLRVLEVAEKDTPSRAEMMSDLAALHAALGEPFPSASSRRAS